MMNKDVKGILALVVVTALSFGVIFGTGKLTKNSGESAAENTGTVQAELDVSGAENIERAVQMDDGSYVVSVKAAGYGGDIHMDVTFDESGKVINSLAVTEQSETENLGAKITEEEFLSQFSGIEAPVYLPGMTLETEMPVKSRRIVRNLRQIRWTGQYLRTVPMRPKRMRRMTTDLRSR